MSGEPEASPIVPRAWRIVFGLEIPITGFSIAYWLHDPAQYLREIFGVTAIDGAHVGLLQQLGATAFSIYVYFYARFLLSRRPHLATFALLQEAVTLSDVLLAYATWLATSAHARSAMQWGGVCIPLVWAAIRVVFIVQTRGLLHASR